MSNQITPGLHCEEWRVSIAKSHQIRSIENRKEQAKNFKFIKSRMMKKVEAKQAQKDQFESNIKLYCEHKTDVYEFLFREKDEDIYKK